MLLLFLVSLLFNCKEEATPKDHWRDQKEGPVLQDPIKDADSAKEKRLVYSLDHLDPADFLLDRKPVMVNSEKLQSFIQRLILPGQLFGNPEVRLSSWMLSGWKKPTARKILIWELLSTLTEK